MVAKAHETIAWLPMTDVMRARTKVGQNKDPTSSYTRQHPLFTPLLLIEYITKKLIAEATIFSHILGIELKKMVDISVFMCFLRYAACPIYVRNTEGNKPKVKLSWKTKVRFLISTITIDVCTIYQFKWKWYNLHKFKY